MVKKSNGRVQKDNPTHTLAFCKFDDNTMIMGWANARGGDAYNKKDGREKATNRMDNMITRMVNFPNRKTLEVSNITSRHIPSQIIENDLEYYIAKARSILFGDVRGVSMLCKTYRREEAAVRVKLS